MLSIAVRSPAPSCHCDHPFLTADLERCQLCGRPMRTYRDWLVLLPVLLEQPVEPHPSRTLTPWPTSPDDVEPGCCPTCGRPSPAGLRGQTRIYCNRRCKQAGEYRRRRERAAA